MTLNQEKQRIVDETVRDICSVSVAPAAKSRVRAIISSGFDALHAALLAEIEREIKGLSDTYQDFLDVCEKIKGDPTRTGVEASIALDRVKHKHAYLLSLLHPSEPKED